VEIEVVENGGNKLNWKGEFDHNLPGEARIAQDSKTLDAFNHGNDTANAVLIRNPEKLEAGVDYYVWFFFDSIPESGVLIQPNIAIDIHSGCSLAKPICNDVSDREVCEYFTMETDKYFKFTAYPDGRDGIKWNDRENSKNITPNLSKINGKWFVIQSSGLSDSGYSSTVNFSAPSSSSKKPAVYVKKLYFEGNKAKFFPENHETVCVDVGNNGKEPKDDVKVTFYRSDGKKVDKNPKEIGEENIKHKNIKKGASKTECTEFRVPNEPGDMYNIQVRLKVDGDKSYYGPILYTIRDRPKIFINDFYLTGTDGSLQLTFAPGQSFISVARIKNSGGDVEEDVKVKFDILNYSQVILATGLENIRDYNLEGGETKKESHLFSAPSASGTYSARVCADPENKIKEKDNSDNCKSISFAVVP
jgi:hypothetical protein